MQFIYKQPVKLYFGNGRVKELPEIVKEIKGTKGLLVCDPFLAKNGEAQKIVDLFNGAIAECYSEITPNPTIHEIQKCADLMKKHDVDFAIGMGGGSAMDLCKCACSLAKSDLGIEEYFYKRATFETGKCIPWIAIPTTAGTASEATPVSVMTVPEKQLKAPLQSDNFYPLIGVVDPLLTVSCPPKVTASCGLDVIAHALEGFWSIHHQPVCDANDFYALRLAFEYLPRAVKDGNDLEAREMMALASMQAGLGFSLPRTAASHACSYPLTAVYGVPHGEACAFTLDKFVKINKDAEGGRLNRLAKDLGFKDADAMADKITEFKKEFGMRCTLKEIGVPEDKIRELAESCVQSPIQNNPVEMNADSLEKMFNELK